MPRMGRVIDLFYAVPSRANFLTTVAFSKRLWDYSEQRTKGRRTFTGHFWKVAKAQKWYYRCLGCMWSQESVQRWSQI